MNRPGSRTRFESGGHLHWCGLRVLRLPLSARLTSGEVSGLSSRPGGIDTRTRYPMSLSSRGLGSLVLIQQTRVRIPQGTQHAPSKWNAASATNAGSSVRIRMGVQSQRRRRAGGPHKPASVGPTPIAGTNMRAGSGGKTSPRHGEDSRFDSCRAHREVGLSAGPPPYTRKRGVQLPYLVRKVRRAGARDRLLTGSHPQGCAFRARRLPLRLHGQTGRRSSAKRQSRVRLPVKPRDSRSKRWWLRAGLPSQRPGFDPR